MSLAVRRVRLTFFQSFVSLFARYKLLPCRMLAAACSLHLASRVLGADRAILNGLKEAGGVLRTSEEAILKVPWLALQPLDNINTGKARTRSRHL